jgi:hypothetical protein
MKSNEKCQNKKENAFQFRLGAFLSLALLNFVADFIKDKTMLMGVENHLESEVSKS